MLQPAALPEAQFLLDNQFGAWKRQEIFTALYQLSSSLTQKPRKRLVTQLDSQEKDGVRGDLNQAVEQSIQLE